MVLQNKPGDDSVFLPIHVAVHALGCAVRTPDGVAMRGNVGPHIECLADSVEKVTVLAHDVPDTPSRYEDLVEFIAHPLRDNITVRSLGPRGNWRNYLQRRRYINQVVSSASNEWDVLLFRMPNRRANLVFRANRCPRIVTMNGSDLTAIVRTSPMPLPKKILSLATAYYSENHFKRIVRSSGLFSVNSEVLLRKYRSLSPDVILQRSSARRARFAYEVSDRMQSPNVKFFFAGRLTGAKGVFELLTIFAQVKQHLFPNAELHVAGVGDAMEEMRQVATSYGIEDSVTFHGWVSADESLFDLYRQMDVFLFLSYVEGFPKVIWEAMANSVPVICTPTGALPEVFRHGQELLYVPIGETTPVFDAIKQLKDDPALRRQLIRNGYQRAKESTLEYVVGDLLQRIVTRWPELATPKSEVPLFNLDD